MAPGASSLGGCVSEHLLMSLSGLPFEYVITRLDGLGPLVLIQWLDRRTASMVGKWKETMERKTTL